MTLVAEQVGLLVATGLVIFKAVYFGVRMGLVHTDLFVWDRERRDLDMRPSVAFTAIAGVGVCICQLADNKTVVVGGVWCRRNLVAYNVVGVCVCMCVYG
jgi:hypothetical protein